MSTPPGFLHARCLSGNGAAESLSWSAVQSWTPERGPLWLHLNFDDPEAAEWLTHHSGLNDIAVNGLLAQDTRPHTLTRGQNLLLILRGVNLNPGEEPDDMVSVRIWTDGQRLISTQRRNLVSTGEVLAAIDTGDGPTSIQELLLEWIDLLTWQMNDTVSNFEDLVLTLEEQVLSGETAGKRIELLRLRKQTIVLRRYLAPQREALNRLIVEQLNWIDDINRLRLREVADRLIRYIEDIDQVTDRASVAQEELMSRLSEQMNERMYVLSIVAALFLPLGFFTGLMGINVGGMPGVDSSDAFWVVVGLCVLILIALAAAFRWKRWF